MANVVGANLLAFQIGNEPDGFGRWTAVRPASYDVYAYLAEWRTFHASIRARVPGALFAGPDVSGAIDWVAAFAQAMPEGLVLLTHHYYADGPAGAPHVSLAKAPAEQPTTPSAAGAACAVQTHVSSTLPDHGNEFHLRRRSTGR